jgi:hypothetical protein
MRTTYRFKVGHVEMFKCEGYFMPCQIRLERIQVSKTYKESYMIRDFVVNLN